MLKQQPPMSITELNCGEFKLQLAPQLGGSILGFWRNNIPLLRPTKPNNDGVITARQTASFPLIPFSNRIANAEFMFLGQRYMLPRDPYEPRHALHGNAFCATWDIEELTHQHVRLFLEYRLDKQDIPYFPFPYKAWQDFSLDQNGLKIELKIQNCGASQFPAGMGHHFYFPLHKTTKLQFNADRYWESDENLLPTQPSNILKEVFSVGEYVCKQVIDNCFEGWDHIAKISNELEGYELNIHCSSDFSYAVLYIPKGKDFFAFEPVTHLNNAINMQGSNGIKKMEPDEIWSAKINLTFKALKI